MTPIDGIDDDIETPEAQQTVEVPELEEAEAFSQEGQDLADPSNDAPFSAEDFGGAEDADDGEAPDELADAEGGEPGDWDFGEQAEETSDMQTEVPEEADPGEWDFGEQGEEMGEQKRGFWDDLKSVFDDSETEVSAFADVLLAGQFVVYQHHAPDAVRLEGIQHFGGQDAGGVDFRQFALQEVEVAGRQRGA